MLLSVKNLESFNNRNSGIYNQSDFDHRKQMMENIKSILAINEESLTADSIKADKKKDADQLSTTSSATNTNFTGNRALITSTISLSIILFYFFTFPPPQ